MNKVDLALDDLSRHSGRQMSSSVREIYWPVPERSSVPDLIKLFMEVENGLRDSGGLIVQFVSISAGCGGESIALDMAWAASAVLGRNIFVLNATTTPYDIDTHAIHNHRQVTNVPDHLNPVVSLETHMVKAIGHGLYVADLREACGNVRALAATDEIISSLRKLSPMFDMIVVAPPPTDIDPFAPAIARHVDGNVLVIEAERTRRSEAVQIRQILSRSGKPILGALLNNRQQHIPQWLTPWV